MLSRELNAALAGAVREHAADPEIAVIVVDGGEARGFSAGVEVADHTPDRVEGMLADFHGAVRAVWESAVRDGRRRAYGFALGGGLELAIACDLVIVEDDARLGFPRSRWAATRPSQPRCCRRASAGRVRASGCSAARRSTPRPRARAGS